MRKNPACYTIGMLIAAIALSLLVEVHCDASQVPLLEPSEAYALILKNKGDPRFVVLDVRTPEEFRTGHIEGAININFYGKTFREEIDGLDRQKTYLVYCRTGRRSKEAVRAMQDLGFTHLLGFEGDIIRWKAENLPVVE